LLFALHFSKNLTKQKFVKADAKNLIVTLECMADRLFLKGSFKEVANCLDLKANLT
jgi:hypothetical protein